MQEQHNEVVTFQLRCYKEGQNKKKPSYFYPRLKLSLGISNSEDFSSRYPTRCNETEAKRSLECKRDPLTAEQHERRLPLAVPAAR
ncbi:Protein of unknown function [Gryllus bimaculatus]|nr:Protein of unknown function [Gryllus bimaculatus]